MTKFAASFVAFYFLCVITACTYNVSMAHTQGTATDTIDDNASNTPTISPVVNIPITPGAGTQITK